MKALRLLHDDVIEAIIRGGEVDPAHQPLADFASQLRALGDGPAPAASPELSALFEGRAPLGLRVVDGDVTVAPHLSGRTRRKRMLLGPMAKLGLGAAIAVAAVGTAGAAGALPAGADHAVRHAIEVVSPVQFTPAAHHDHPDNFGGRVSADATGDSDGTNGVDGQTISSEAPGAGHRNGGSSPTQPPGQTGVTGLDRANQTPADGHAPTTPGAPTANAGSSNKPPNTGDSAVDGVHGSRPATVPSTVPTQSNPAHPTGR